MKKSIFILVVSILTINFSVAQNMKDSKMMKEKESSMKMMEHKTIELTQVSGEFVQKKTEVTAGDYVFKIKNDNVGHDVGFVLVKKGKDVSNPANHIKTAYVTSHVKNNSTESSKVTTLEAGEYVYFCPLNPTSTDNLLIVR